jgi:hypothetical protein
LLKKGLTVREHLKMIQSDGGKVRWAELTPEERSAQARKIAGAGWAKKKAGIAAEAKAVHGEIVEQEILRVVILGVHHGEAC